MFRANYYSAGVPFESQPYVFMNSNKRWSSATVFEHTIAKTAKSPMTVKYTFPMLRLM